uniref:Histonelysine Nmethyltransferase SETMARlike [Ceratitis capitata] n=1 Tax=Lepeophtheirus salmonis TaxID=72036 RepID=A0A0K2UG07_LEPSM
MEISKEEIRHILHFYYLQGKNASKATKKICDVYGDDTISVRVAQQWFQRFRSGITEVNDAPRTGRPVVEYVDKIIENIKIDRHVSSRSIAQELIIDHKTVLNHLQKAGYKKKLDVWVPHEPTQKNLMDRITICESLLNRNKIDPFLKRIIIGDEKWIPLVDVKRQRKVLLCVWWDWQGMIYYELLPDGQTINSALYCEQLDRLKPAIEQKRPALVNGKGIMIHLDNARPHTSFMTRQKLRELGWEVLMHPPYSPDLAPSDYHLFLPMANALGGTNLASIEACENWLSQFFSNRDKDFYEKGIMKLDSRWQQVIEQNGAYLA